MLSSHQYGFRMGLSAILGIYDVQENILENLEKDFITCTIFCDLSKAFDTIDHDVLLWKLNNFFGIRGLPLKLLANYLHGRQQYTVIDVCTSATLNITQGVPQGSSLGPLLFALYINDLPSTTKLTPTLFADDTVLSISGSNSTELQSIVNTELEKVNEGLHFNKLSLNYSKTSYMIVSRKNNQLTDFNVKINDKTITRTTWGKYLGVFIDDKLTWSNHIAYLKNTLSRSVGLFYQIRQYLSDGALKSLYFSFVYSHLQFAIGAWSGIGITTLNQLNVLHNKIIRAMTYSSFRTKITPLYKKLKLLKAG